MECWRRLWWGIVLTKALGPHLGTASLTSQQGRHTRVRWGLPVPRSPPQTKPLPHDAALAGSVKYLHGFQLTSRVPRNRRQVPKVPSLSPHSAPKWFIASHNETSHGPASPPDVKLAPTGVIQPTYNVVVQINSFLQIVSVAANPSTRRKYEASRYLKLSSELKGGTNGNTWRGIDPRRDEHLSD